MSDLLRSVTEAAFALARSRRRLEQAEHDNQPSRLRELAAQDGTEYERRLANIRDTAKRLEFSGRQIGQAVSDGERAALDEEDARSADQVPESRDVDQWQDA